MDTRSLDHGPKVGRMSLFRAFAAILLPASEGQVDLKHFKGYIGILLDWDNG